MTGLGLAALAALMIVDGSTLPTCSLAELSTQGNGLTDVVPIADLPVPRRRSEPYQSYPHSAPKGFFEQAFDGGVAGHLPADRPAMPKAKLKPEYVAPPGPVAPVGAGESESPPAVDTAQVPPASVAETPVPLRQTVSYAQEQRSGPPTVVIVFLVVIILLFSIGALILGAHLGETFERRSHEKKAREENERIKRLRKEREIVRLSNQVDDAREWAKLRELRIDAAKARLQGKADEHRIDGVVTRRALDDLLNGGPHINDAPPLVVAERHLAEEIEGRKADGLDTSALDLALERVRQARTSS